MAAPRRTRQLEAPPRFTPVVDGAVAPPAPRVWDDPEPDPAPAPAPAVEPVLDVERPPAHLKVRSSRSALLGLGVGLAMAVAGIAIAFSVIAVPLFALASIDPGSGLDRDLVRKGLLFVALPFGAIAGTFCGVAVGIWYGRGGRLPQPDRNPYER